MPPDDAAASPVSQPEEVGQPPAAEAEPDAEAETASAGQQLGRVERPPADQYRGQRRLLLLPLMFAPPAEPDVAESDGQTIYDLYWEQARTQIDALASGLGGLHRIYHESLVEGGDSGLAYLQMADQRAHAMIQVRCQAGAALEATESIDLLTETLDLQRCLLIPFTNDRVATRLQEWHTEANQNRYRHIARQIDQTLQPDETGLLLINERHQVQFPTDIQVFYIAPPALDEYRRWLQNWATRRERAAAEAIAGNEYGDSDDAEDGGE